MAKQEAETILVSAGKIQLCLLAWMQTLGSGGGEGLSAITGTNPLPDQFSSIQGQISDRTPGHQHRSASASDQRSCEKSSASTQPIHQQALCGPQEGWVTPSCDQLETPQYLHGQLSFQDGRDPQSEGPVEKRGLDVLSRSEGCLSFSSHCRAPQEIPSIRMGRQHLRIHLSTVWSLQCTKDFHEAPSSSCGTPAVLGSEDGSILGRHPANGRRPRDPAETSSPDHLPPGGSGLHSEQAKVSVRSLPADNLPGVPGRLTPNAAAFTRGKNTTDCDRLQENADKRDHYGTRIGIHNWKTVSNTPRSTTSPPVHSPPPTSDDPVPEESLHTTWQYNTEPGLPERGTLVDPPPPEVERERHYSTPSRPDHTIGCVPPRLGCSLQWDENRRPLVRPREVPTHQFPRTPGRVLRNQSFHQTQQQDPCPTADGQQHSSSLCKQNGWHTFTEPVPPSLPPVALVPREGNSSVCPTPSRSSEHRGRSGIEADRSLNRMDATQGSVPLDTADTGAVPDGFFRDQTEPPT